MKWWRFDPVEGALHFGHQKEEGWMNVAPKKEKRDNPK